MEIKITFDVDLDGDIDEDQAKKIFFQRLGLTENVIAEEDGKFAIIVVGWSMDGLESFTGHGK